MQAAILRSTSTAVARRDHRPSHLLRKTNSIEWHQLENQLVGDAPGAGAESEAAIATGGAVDEADFAASVERLVDARQRAVCPDTRAPSMWVAA